MGVFERFECMALRVSVHPQPESTFITSKIELSTQCMVELSVIIPTILEDEREIVALQYLKEDSSEEYEVVIRRDEGATLARNAGVKQASADKIIFLDDDSMPRPGYLEAASDALDEHLAVTGRVFQPPDAPFGDKDLPWYDQGDEPKRTELLAGCNMAMQRKLFETVGGFDEDLYFGHEETELAERICEEHSIHYVPEMVIDHYFAKSILGYWRKAYRHGRADVRLWELKGFPWRERLTLSIPIIIPRNGVVEAGSRMSRRFGRLNGLLFG